MCLEGYVPTALLLWCTCARCYVDVRYPRLCVSLSLCSSALCHSFSLPLVWSLSSRPSSIRVCCALPISLGSLPLSLSPCPSPSYSLSLVVSSSRRTLSFAPYCHASVPLPAIRNVAVALPRYLRDVSYAAPPTRVVPLVSTWLLACRSLAFLPACLRATWAKEHAERVCLPDVYVFFQGEPLSA